MGGRHQKSVCDPRVSLEYKPRIKKPNHEEICMALNQVGLRINTEYQRVDATLVERVRKVPVAVLGDVANRLQSFGAGFLQYGGKKKFAGPALTVRVRPG